MRQVNNLELENDIKLLTYRCLAISRDTSPNFELLCRVLITTREEKVRGANWRCLHGCSSVQGRLKSGRSIRTQGTAWCRFLTKGLNRAARFQSRGINRRPLFVGRTGDSFTVVANTRANRCAWALAKAQL
jgi:hypothetical protein